MTYPRSNADIALQLLSQFKGLIDGIAYKMGVRYHLSQQDREDLVAAAQAKLAAVHWTIVWRRVRRSYRRRLASGASPSLDNYAISTIQGAMINEVRRIKAFGLSGLSKGPPISAFPAEDDSPQPERGMDGLPDRLAAHQIVLLASQVLDHQEQSVIALLYGFDGGPARTEMQVARELDLSRAKVANLVESAMAKLRRVTAAR